MFRGEDVIYNNQALRKLFNVDGTISNLVDVKKFLENCKIKSYARELKKESKRQPKTVLREMTVLEFI